MEVFKGAYGSKEKVYKVHVKVWSMCRKSLSLILPFSQNVGGASENNLSSGGGNLKKKTVFESSNA